MRDAPRPKAMEAQPRRQEQRRPRRDDGLADSVRRIARSTRGRVINAERVQSDGRSINRIKVMDDRGRISVYMDDPQARRRRSEEHPYGLQSLMRISYAGFCSKKKTT